MNITRFNKTLTVLGIVVFFIFGALAVSPAHDSPLGGQVYALGQHHGFLAHDPVQVDIYTLAVGLEYETSELAGFARAHPVERRCTYPQDELGPSARNHVQSPKVSFLILESVLII